MRVYSYMCKKCKCIFDKLYTERENEHIIYPKCGSSEVITKQASSLSTYISTYLTEHSANAGN